MTDLLAVLAAYLMGSIPFAQLLSKRRGIDLRRVGSGNVGASNVLRTLGVRPPDQLDEMAAREIAVREGVGVVLAGSLLRDGDGYTIAVKATRTVTGEVLTDAETDADSKEEIVEAATQLMTTVRTALGDEASESAQMFAMASLSATSLARLRDEPEALAADLARPMPRKPSPAARFGTRFHAWVEARFGQQQLVGLDEVPGRGDEGIEDERELKELIEQFTSGPFGDRVPNAVEPPFALVLGGQVVRGRIDAVYETPTGFLVVDWKTNHRQSADPLQLAIYRVAWAELAGVPAERVEAAFFYVRTGVLDQPGDLPGRDELEAIIAGDT